jgi:predicted transcriptional regulator
MHQLDDVLFLSLRPTFAELILAGEKTVELRRIRPRARPGTLVLVYASSPVMQVVGTCVVEEIGTATPAQIWKLHGRSTGLDWKAVSEYFAGKTKGVAITITRPIRLATPVSLEAVRARLGDSVPPQSFRYIKQADARFLIDLGCCEQLGAPS